MTTSTHAKRILVTGGAGFIGSHLCERLLARGDRVVCLDDFSTGSRENLAHLRADPAFRLVEQDVTAPIGLPEPVDEIYNLACPASPVQYQRDPVRTIRTNVLGAIGVLDLARELGAKVLQASTSEVYGDPEIHPQPEDYPGRVNPVGPRACYDEGKRSAETLFFDYHREHGVRIRVARIFNTYGPRMQPDDGRVVSSFAARALAQEPITLFGGGGQTRSFCFVDDLVDGLVRLMDAPDAPVEPVNLGRPVETTIRELAERILIETGSTSELVEAPLPADDPIRRCPDIGRARARLGWEPKIDLSVGLRPTVRYLATRIGRADPGYDGATAAERASR